LRFSIAKIGLFLILIIILPTVFFSAYEVSNLYRNEQMIDSIYIRQLESVLFSINQYSDDVVSSWASDVDDVLKKEDNQQQQEKLNDFIKGHISINCLFLADTLTHLKIFTNKTEPGENNLSETKIKSLLATQETTIRKLYKYIKNGYRKIQPVDITDPGNSLFLFLTEHGQTQNKVCGIIVNTESFIKENLGPKIQTVAQNTFFISVFDKETGNEVYSNELSENPNRHIEHKKSIWLFPDYELGIDLKGETISKLVSQRTYYNIMVFIVLDIVLLLAAWFVYRAVRQELKLAQLKSEFVSNVSHEIRTPLAIINMYSETLQMNRIKSEEKKLEYYKVINTETNRLSGIVNNILSFSKIESGKRAYKFEEVDLNRIVSQIIETYQHHFINHGFTCDFKSTKEDLFINADKEAVTDAIINLVDNAIKYSNTTKQIDIKTGSEKEFVFVEITDYGIGIDGKDQKLVFDKFYRVTSGDLAYKSEGSGIGLSIVKHIMDAHMGTVSLKSKLGEGSSFRLNFPKKSFKNI